MKKRDNVEMTWLMVFWFVRFPWPEGRQVYRPWDCKFTARGAVSNEPKEKSDGD